MNNDYERYDFWFRETKVVNKPERTIRQIIDGENPTNELLPIEVDCFNNGEYVYEHNSDEK
jgi:hypothetical protein